MSKLTVLFTVDEVAKKLERLRGEKSGGSYDQKPRLLTRLVNHSVAQLPSPQHGGARDG